MHEMTWAEGCNATSVHQHIGYSKCHSNALHVTADYYRKHIIKIYLGDCAPNNIKHITLDLQGAQDVNTPILKLCKEIFNSMMCCMTMGSTSAALLTCDFESVSL